LVAYYAKYVVNATGMLMTNYGHNRVYNNKSSNMYLLFKSVIRET